MSLYRGPLFIFSTIITSIPLTIITVWAAGSIIYWSLQLRHDAFWLERWSIFCAILWAIYTFAEQHTIAIMCFIKSPFIAAITSIYFLCFDLILGSGTLRSMWAAPDWLNWINFANIYYYSGWTLHFSEFQYNPALDRTPSVAENFTTFGCPVNLVPGRCMFIDGKHFLEQRFNEGKDWPEWSLMHWKNFALNYLFILAFYLINTIIYIVPLPASLKSKFRD